MNELSEFLLQYKLNEPRNIKFYDLHINNIDEDKKFFNDYVVYGKLNFIKFLVNINSIIDHVYIAPKNMPGIFWTKCSSVDEIQNVLKLYNIIPHTEPPVCSTFYGFIDCEHKISLDVIEKFVLLHPVIDKFMWGPEYANPIIKGYEMANPFNCSILLSQLCENNNEKSVKLTIKTKYSGSYISFEGTSDNIQYISVSYNNSMVKNNNMHKFNEFKCTSFSDYIPPDIMSILMTMPKIIQYDDLLKGKITEYNVILAIILATKSDKGTLDIVDKFTQLIENKKISEVEELIEDKALMYIKDFLQTHHINLIIDETLSNNKELAKKITKCNSDKKIKKCMSELKLKCNFDKDTDKTLIKQQLKYIIKKLSNEFE